MSEPLDLEALFIEMETEIDEACRAIEVPPVWAIKMVFTDDVTDEKIARLYPLTFPNRESAEEISNKFSDPAAVEMNIEVFAVLVSKGRWEFPIGRSWTAAFHSVVRLDVSETVEGEEN